MVFCVASPLPSSSWSLGSKFLTFVLSRTFVSLSSSSSSGSSSSSSSTLVCFPHRRRRRRCPAYSQISRIRFVCDSRASSTKQGRARLRRRRKRRRRRRSLLCVLPVSCSSLSFLPPCVCVASLCSHRLLGLSTRLSIPRSLSPLPSSHQVDEIDNKRKEEEEEDV